VRLFGGEFIGGEFLSGGEGVGGGNLDVGLDAGTFPVGLGDGVDGAGEGDANPEIVVNAVTGDGMGAASRGLASAGYYRCDKSRNDKWRHVGREEGLSLDVAC
jgi:hypothetical protein